MNKYFLIFALDVATSAKFRLNMFERHTPQIRLFGHDIVYKQKIIPTVNRLGTITHRVWQSVTRFTVVSSFVHYFNLLIDILKL